MGKSITRAGATTIKVRVAAACLAVLIAMLIPAQAQAAIVDADTMSIASVKVFHNLAEDGDFLIVFHYKLSWTDPANQPDTSADENFIFRLTSTTETTIYGMTVPYPYMYDGYGEGCASMYFSADDAPAWGNSYILRFEENIGQDPSPKIVRQTVSGDDYSPFDETGDNQDWLRDYIIDVALELEAAWDAPGGLISESNYLTAAGETYFGNAIPGFRSLCPNIYSIQYHNPNVAEENWTQAQANAYQNQWANVTWLSNSLTGLSDLFGGVVGWQVITAILCAVVSLGLIVFSYIRLESAKPGLLLGSLPLIAGSMLGFFPLAVLGLIAFGAAIFIVYTFFLKRAG